MKINLFLFLAISVLFSSCQKREWNNPFDADCPKELYTPTSFSAALVSNAVLLSWSQSDTKISGFVIERSVAGGAWTSVATPDKSATNWSDTNLTGGKVHAYHIVAKAGTNLSNQLTAQITPLFSSTITTTVITKLLSTSAILGGNITNDGGAIVTARGVCWNTSTNPTTFNSKTSDGTGTGAFTSTITGLTANTTYYARAYATNSIGTTYGNEITFKTYYGEVADVDGNVYSTIKIGNQIWMAENLKTTKYNDGTAIPNVTDNTAWAALATGAYCWYNNDVNNKNVYGALYNWYAVSTNKLAPAGWHVPTDGEWTTLTNYLGGVDVAGGKLRETGTAHWKSPNTGATNESGFNALPSGFRQDNLNNGFIAMVTDAGFWSSTTYPAWNTAWFRQLNYSNTGVYIGNPRNREYGNSVRCILGTLSLPTITSTAISEITFESAILGGNVTSDGNSTVTERGIVYGTATNPTLVNTKVVIGSGTGSFSSKITGLSNNITYYVRAYATNSLGTVYGEQQSFTLYMNVPGPSVTDIDGNVYKTVKIGGQIWMAENLRVTKYRDGTAIPNVIDGTTWASLASGAYCDFSNSIANGATYGHLYNYYSIVDNRQLSPTGWHIPSEAEWTILSNYLGGGKSAGAALKETGTTHWISPNTGTNSSGFTAFAGSWRGGDGVFYYGPTIVGYWWSSTTYNSIYSYFLGIASDNNATVISSDAYFQKPAGCSIRCIKD